MYFTPLPFIKFWNFFRPRCLLGPSPEYLYFSKFNSQATYNCRVATLELHLDKIDRNARLFPLQSKFVFCITHFTVPLSSTPFSELHTNLASLRRGDTDPFTPPDAAFVRDSKMRRSKAAKELLKKNNPLSPMQVGSLTYRPCFLNMKYFTSYVFL